MNGRKREASDVLPLYRSAKQPRTNEQAVLHKKPQLRSRWATLGREVITLASDTFHYIYGVSELPPPLSSRPRARSLPAGNRHTSDDTPVASSSRTEMGPPPLPSRFAASSDTLNDAEIHSTAATSPPASSPPSAASTPLTQTLSVQSTSALTNGTLPRLKHRPHIFERQHKEKVETEKKRQREELMKKLYDLKRADGYESSYDVFTGYMSYRQRLENLEKGSILSPSPSFNTLSRVVTPELNRQHSVSPLSLFEEVQPEFLQRAIKNVQDTLKGPKPVPPFSPGLDILSKKRWARDAEIEARLRPKRPPLPTSLPPADEAQVDALLAKRGPIAKFGREQVADKDLVRLKPGQWLNDELINFYGAMLLARAEGAKENAGMPVNGATRGTPLNAFYFSTFFWQKLCNDGYEKGRLAKWTKKVDIFSKDILLIPINHSNSHWTAAAINFRRKRVESYDSMGMARQNVFKMLRVYLDAEHRNKKKQPFDFTDWDDLVLEDTPQQENYYDCGVFTCQFLESLSRGEESFNFKQSDMPYLRRRMIWEIGNAKLRDD